MSNPPDRVILLPSEAYREATSSLVYRLSELMFGSLLAAYSLGFVGALGAQGYQLSARGNLGIISLPMQYACISIAFAFLTTSFYLTYHRGILTLPQFPFARLGRDFTIAVFQAIFFGFSMLVPVLFPLFLTLNFCMSSHRKNEEYKNLADDLFQHNCLVSGRADPNHLPQFRLKLAEHLQSKKHLSHWAPIGSKIRKYTWCAGIVGVIVFFLWLALEFDKLRFLRFLTDWLVQNEEVREFLSRLGLQELLTRWGLQQVLITGEVLLATVLIWKHGGKVLKRHSSFIGFPIRDIDFCRFQDFCKYRFGGKAGTELGMTEDLQLNISGTTGEGPSDSLGSAQADMRYEMDKEFMALEGELKKICEEARAQS